MFSAAKLLFFSQSRSKSSLWMLFAINIFWTDYLFDCFLIGGWFFT